MQWIGGRIDCAGLVVTDVPAELLRLRIQLADGDAQHGPRFQHAGAGGHQGQILFVRDIDKPIECRVMVDGPPVLVVLMIGFDRGMPDSR